MLPAHRHLGDRPAEPARSKQHLGVEAEAQRAQRLEAGHGGFGSERLEAALGVVQSRATRPGAASGCRCGPSPRAVPVGAHRSWNRAAHAMRSRPRSSRAAQQEARSTSSIGVLRSASLKTRCSPLAVSMPSRTAAPLPVFCVEGEHLQLRPALGGLDGDRDRVVGAAVVDDQHLVRLVGVRRGTRASSTRVAGRRCSSLYAGTTMLSIGRSRVGSDRLPRRLRGVRATSTAAAPTAAAGAMAGSRGATPTPYRDGARTTVRDARDRR